MLGCEEAQAVVAPVAAIHRFFVDGQQLDRGDSKFLEMLMEKNTLSQRLNCRLNIFVNSLIFVFEQGRFPRCSGFETFVQLLLMISFKDMVYPIFIHLF